MTDAVKRICKQWISAGYGDEYFWDHWPECPSEESLTPNQLMAAVAKLEAANQRLKFRNSADAVEFVRRVANTSGPNKAMIGMRKEYVAIKKARADLRSTEDSHDD